MKSVQTLIKLQQRQLDDRRRALKQLQDEEAMLQMKREEYKKSIIDERKKAAADLEASITLPAFIKMTERNIEVVSDRILYTQKQMVIMQEEIAGIFRELKRYEIYNEMKEAEEKLEENKREQKEMDEMGLRSFIYKEGAE